MSELDRAGLGPAQPTHPHKPPPQRSPSKGVTTPRGSSWGSGDGTPVAEHAMEAGNVEVGGVRITLRGGGQCGGGRGQIEFPGRLCPVQVVGVAVAELAVEEGDVAVDWLLWWACLPCAMWQEHPWLSVLRSPAMWR